MRSGYVSTAIRGGAAAWVSGLWASLTLASVAKNSGEGEATQTLPRVDNDSGAQAGSSSLHWGTFCLNLD